MPLYSVQFNERKLYVCVCCQLRWEIMNSNCLCVCVCVCVCVHVCVCVLGERWLIACFCIICFPNVHTQHLCQFYIDNFLSAFFFLIDHGSLSSSYNSRNFFRWNLYFFFFFLQDTITSWIYCSCLCKTSCKSAYISLVKYKVLHGHGQCAQFCVLYCSEWRWKRLGTKPLTVTVRQRGEEGCSPDWESNLQTSKSRVHSVLCEPFGLAISQWEEKSILCCVWS